MAVVIRLNELEVVYVWVDGVYVKAGFEREKAAVLVAIGALQRREQGGVERRAWL